MIKLVKSGSGNYCIHTINYKHQKECFYGLFASLILGVKIHENWDLSFLGDYRFRENNEPNKEKYQKLLELNPRLKVLNDKYPKDKLSIYMGAVSLFNYDDIEYFLESGAWCTSPMCNRIKQEKLEKELNFEFQWVISKKTLDLIDRVDKKNINISHIENIINEKIKKIYEEKTIDYMIGCLSG